MGTDRELRPATKGSGNSRSVKTRLRLSPRLSPRLSQGVIGPDPPQVRADILTKQPTTNLREEAAD
jgi:hypothetical protein